MAQYDFTNYYRQAYLEKKEQNVSLACDTAEKEQAVVELRQKYERIAGNPVIRLLRGMKKIPGKMKKNGMKNIQDAICEPQSMSVMQYEKEVRLQKEPYQKWILQNEKDVPKEEAKRTEIVQYGQCDAKFSLAEIKETYVIFCADDGKINNVAKRTVEQYFEEHPDVRLLYCAEDEMEQTRSNPWFKPAFSPETLLSFFYFGSMFAICKEAFAGISWLGSDNAKENIYDFVLKATESIKKENIANIERVLFHGKAGRPRIWGYEVCYTKIKTDAMKRRGYDAYTEQTNVPDVHSLCVKCDDKISIVILSKDNPDVLKKCICSIREKTDYEHYEIIVVDNGSHEANRRKVEDLSVQLGFQYICEPMDFNFSKMCNIGAAHARGKYLLLLNDDMEVIEGGWLRRMVGQASVEGVGAVGAKLWYPDSIAIQHAGITNLEVGPAHKLVISNDNMRYYDGRNYFNYNVLAVTGACLMVKKEIYDEIGGLDPTMPVAYNDVEFCFALHKRGYRNVLRNDCILVHHESLSRGLDEESKEKAERLLQERARLYEKYPEYNGKDEYYSKHLVQDSPLYACAGGNEKAVPKPVMETKSKNNAKAVSPDTMANNIEKCELSDGILELSGWSILKGADNCHYKKRFLLRGVQTKKVYVAETQSFYREDVPAVFVGEIRTELSGMETKAIVKTIPDDTYQIGILYVDMLSDKMYYCMTKQEITIK